MEALKTAPGVIGISTRVYILPKDVMQLLGCQANRAYQAIREVNSYAKKNGKFTFPQGRANKYMFSERFGIPLEIIDEVISKEQK